MISYWRHVQVAGEVPYTFDAVMEVGGLFGALATTSQIGIINGLSMDVAMGMYCNNYTLCSDCAMIPPLTSMFVLVSYPITIHCCYVGLAIT